MKLQKQVKWRYPDASHSDTIKKILIGGIAGVFFLTLAGCITGAPGTVARTSPAKKTPPASAADATLASKPTPAKPIVKTSETGVARSVKTETPPASPKKTIQKLKPEPVSAKKVDTTSEVPTSPASVKTATKPDKAVEPVTVASATLEPLAFHLKKEEPEDVSESATIAPKPATDPIIIYTLPKNKKFHGLHAPIKKEGSCVSGKCHAEKLKEDKYVHAPVATGACILCHGDTKANPPYGLIRSGQDLCLSCHKEMIPVLAQAKSIHEPVKRNCTGCHNPHSAGSKVLLREPAKTLCITCHEKATPDFVARIRKAGLILHKPVAEGKCSKCHSAHVSNFPSLLKKGPKEVDLCFSCHEEMGANIKKAAFKHGPVQDGLCNACHKPHVSPNVKMLKYFYVKKFYNPFDPEVYSLCFKCHKESVVLNKRTTTLTNFRNGDRNLHFLHVNREKGRTCLACHEVHAGSQERKIRLATPFGDWEIPIKYQKSTTGGTCAASCHVEKRYDRNRPVKLEIDAEELAQAKIAKKG